MRIHTHTKEGELLINGTPFSLQRTRTLVSRQVQTFQINSLETKFMRVSTIWFRGSQVKKVQQNDPHVGMAGNHFQTGAIRCCRTTPPVQPVQHVYRTMVLKRLLWHVEQLIGCPCNTEALPLAASLSTTLSKYMPVNLRIMLPIP